MKVKACMPWPWWRERNSRRGVALVMPFAASISISIGLRDAAYDALTGCCLFACHPPSGRIRILQVWLLPLTRYNTCTHKLDLHASAGAHTVKSGVTWLLMQP